MTWFELLAWASIGLAAVMVFVVPVVVALLRRWSA